MNLEPNKYYKTRDGRKVGPLSYCGPVWSNSTRTEHWFEDGSRNRHKDEPGDIIADWVNDGPVREVTRKEIVPGTYGIVGVGDVGVSGERAPVGLVGGTLFRTAAELREAAATFNAIAEVLEQ